MHGHTRLHDSRRNKRSNLRGWTPQCIVRAHTQWLAVHKTVSKGIITPLALQGWDSSHRLDCHHRKNNHTYITTRQSNKSTTYQSYGHRKNNNAIMQVYICEQYECWYRKSNQKLSHISWLSGHTTKRCSSHIKYLRCHGNLSELSSLQLITITIYGYHSKSPFVKRWRDSAQIT